MFNHLTIQKAIRYLFETVKRYIHRNMQHGNHLKCVFIKIITAVPQVQGYSSRKQVLSCAITREFIDGDNERKTSGIVLAELLTIVGLINQNKNKQRLVA